MIPIKQWTLHLPFLKQYFGQLHKFIFFMEILHSSSQVKTSVSQKHVTPKAIYSYIMYEVSKLPLSYNLLSTYVVFNSHAHCE